MEDHSRVESSGTKEVGHGVLCNTASRQDERTSFFCSLMYLRRIGVAQRKEEKTPSLLI